MSIEVENALSFDTFWNWLKRHTGCILRAGSPEVYVEDHELFHWRIEEDINGSPNLFVFLGKSIVAELALDPRDIQFVQVHPAKNPDEPEQCFFQIIGGPADDPFPLLQFLMAHGFEDEPDKSASRTFKH